MKISLTKLVIATSMIGMFLLALNVLALGSIALTFISFFCLFIYRKFTIDKIGLIVLINFFYWLASGFLTGAIDITTLLSPYFYEGDGRIFLSYFSLLFFCVNTTTLSSLKFSLGMIKWIAIISTVLFVIWLPFKPGFLSEGMANNFAGFLTSHTGAGTFFGFISIFLFFNGYTSKNKTLLVLSIIMLLVVFGTGSRATLVGLFVVGVWYVVGNFQVKKFLAIGLLGLVLVFIMPLVAQHTYERTFSLLNEDTFNAIKDQIEIGSSDNFSPGDEDRELAGAEVNVLSRILFWSYAIHRFTQSPFIGIGWGRYNDVNIQMSGIPGLIDMATIGEQRFGAANAHNSYLMLLCESGIVGLALLLWIWIAIYQRMRKAASSCGENRGLKGYFVSCQALVIFTMTAALFGHSLGAPSNCIPVLTVIGAGISYYRGVSGKEENSSLRSNLVSPIVQ